MLLSHYTDVETGGREFKLTEPKVTWIRILPRGDKPRQDDEMENNRSQDLNGRLSPGEDWGDNCRSRTVTSPAESSQQ